MNKYYCYAYLFETVEGEGGPKTLSCYVGQATSPLRVLDHLASSHNAGVASLMREANTWPAILTFSQPQDCRGDLGILESALVSIAHDATLPYRGKLNTVLNRQNPPGTCWVRGELDVESEEGDFRTPLFRIRTDNPTGVDDDVLPTGVDDEAELWTLASWDFCQQENEDATRNHLRMFNQCINQTRNSGLASLEGMSDDGLWFLPKPDSPIRRINDWGGLRHELDKAGLGAAIVVKISNQALPDGRGTAGPGITPEDLRSRVLKYWPVSNAQRPFVEKDVPCVLIAVLGAGDFKLVLGAWGVKPRADSLIHGIWEWDGVNEDLAGLRGQVLHARFTQATYPIYYIPSEGEATWVGSNGSRAIFAAQAEFDRASD